MRANRKGMAIAGSLLTLGFLAGLPRVALADERDISVGGVWVCRISHDVSGYTAVRRATEVRKRITNVLSIPRLRRGAVITVRPTGHDAVVTVGEILVFTVTPADATVTSVTPLELAHQWAARLAAGLSKALPDATFHTF